MSRCGLCDCDNFGKVLIDVMISLMYSLLRITPLSGIEISAGNISLGADFVCASEDLPEVLGLFAEVIRCGAFICLHLQTGWLLVTTV